VDETDRYEDNVSKRRAKRLTTNAIMRGFVGTVVQFCLDDDDEFDTQNRRASTHDTIGWGTTPERRAVRCVHQSHHLQRAERRDVGTADDVRQRRDDRIYVDDEPGHGRSESGMILLKGGGRVGLVKFLIF
jgi:hypothetical protein